MWNRKDLYKDITGLRMGNLVAVKPVGSIKGAIHWLCKCDCGNEKIVMGCEFSRGKGGLKCKECHLNEKRERAKKHGLSYSKFYSIWNSMRGRCKSLVPAKFKTYRGRGISYDPRWEYFNAFYKDMYFKWVYARKKYGGEDELTIEREDNEKGYNFDNCTFIPMSKQYDNKRSLVWFRAISPEGEIYIVKNASKFSREHNLNANHITGCVRGDEPHHKGWRFQKLCKIKTRQL